MVLKDRGPAERNLAPTPDDWFVSPDSKRLPLGTGRWIEVKCELPFGEAERLRANALKLKMSSRDMGSGTPRDDNVSIDMSAYKLERMVTYIVDWNARDRDGKSVPLTRDALAALREKAAREIDEALDRHITEMSEAAENPTNVIDAVSVSP